MVPNHELGKMPKIRPELASNQIGRLEFFRQIATALDQYGQVVDDIPVTFLAAVRQLCTLVVQNKEDEVVTFLSLPHHTLTIVKAVWQVLGTRANAAFPTDLGWASTQRLLSRWFSVVTYPIGKLKESYANFQAPVAFEGHVARVQAEVMREREGAFGRTMFQWVEPAQVEGGLPGLNAFEFDGTQLLGTHSFRCFFTIASKDLLALFRPFRYLLFVFLVYLLYRIFDTSYFDSNFTNFSLFKK